MDLILAIFQHYTIAREAAAAVGSISDWVIDVVNSWSNKTSSSKIEAQVETIGRATEADIRRAAAKAFDDKSKPSVPAAEREALINILLNMVRNVRFRKSFGLMDGSLFRIEQTLNWLFADVEPARHRGEPVAPGSPWIIQKHLGSGSFGEVWLAKNPGYPIPRAYKFFTRDHSGESLRRELRGLAAILRRLGEHDNIVGFEDSQAEGCEYPYLAFEYLEGGSLEEWLVKDKDRRPALETQEIIRQVVEGLAAAHDKNISHRDIKPANILLTEGPDVRIKIGDFGLARVASSAQEGASRMASMAGMVGTSLYLPPEAQQRGIRRNSKQDDVFALGVVWYQLAVGAIERPSYDFAERLKSKSVDSHTIRLIERCLAHPSRRFADAKEVAEVLTGSIPGPVDCPPGELDVQHIAREYLSTLAR